MPWNRVRAGLDVNGVQIAAGRAVLALGTLVTLLFNNDEILFHNLTLAELLARPRLGAEGVEVAFVLLGIPDVLLITRSEDWSRNLALLARRIQDESGRGPSGCRVLVAGVPPLSDFRPISATLRRIITKQVDRLNAVSLDVATSAPGLTFVPFPAWRIGDMYIKQLFSWKALHETWAQSLAAAVAGGR